MRRVFGVMVSSSSRFRVYAGKVCVIMCLECVLHTLSQLIASLCSVLQVCNAHVHHRVFGGMSHAHTYKRVCVCDAIWAFAFTQLGLWKSLIILGCVLCVP